jgi:hypothetical protein
MLTYSSANTVRVIEPLARGGGGGWRGKDHTVGEICNAHKITGGNYI